jgi:hypothetical protein
MRSRGNKPLEKKENIITLENVKCMCCGRDYNENEFYTSDSDLYSATGILPYCKKCIDENYQNYIKKYNNLKYINPERKALERLCMAFDVYYSDEVFSSVESSYSETQEASFIASYFRRIKLYQYRKKDYDTTILERCKEAKDSKAIISMDMNEDIKNSADVQEAKKIFGNGFKDDDYRYLYDQYLDWTARHECQTKAQEEIFKRICFKQLEILKATRCGDDTKDLDFTFQKLLETAKLQPKQNSGDTTSETQTFGTLIDKWENTRPIPEIDEDLRDVDKIGLYLDVFFKGHLAKMMGMKNGLSNLYTKFIKKYTVEKPEYNDEEDSEALFDAIFGNVNIDDID